MPILSPVGRKSLSQRAAVLFIYVNLVVFGATMLIPFLITITGSTTNAFDYERFSILPRALWSSSDRFTKGLFSFFNGYPNWHVVLRNYFPSAPLRWSSWAEIGASPAEVDRFAASYLDASSVEKMRWQRQAADYAEFAHNYPLEDSVATFTNQEAANFIARRYRDMVDRASTTPLSKKERDAAALRLISQEWGVPINSFYSISFTVETRSPMGQQSWAPPMNPKWMDFQALLHALRHGFATPGVQGKWRAFLRQNGYDDDQATRLSPLPVQATPEEKALWIRFARDHAPASPVIPYPMRVQWMEFLFSDEARPLLGLGSTGALDITRFNQLAGTNYRDLDSTPFPLPAAGFEGLRPAWAAFVETRYPLRLTSIPAESLQTNYQEFLATRFKSVENARRLIGLNAKAWSDILLSPNLPEGTGAGGAGLREVWMDFVKTLPAHNRIVTSSEAAYQSFLLQKYGSVPAVNDSYGWDIQIIEEARPPFDKAYTLTYETHRLAFALEAPLANYRTISQFLLHRGNALPVTLWLLILSILCSLTVNPLAGYALSRFSLRNKDKIIIYLLATSAFPAMVSAIPGYLLMRDLGLLNTFFALVLPGAASGMGIFILKGFFDSLPPELYEAATIDGAKEWQIFLHVSLPMITPILAVNSLNAFLAAYSSWEWALIICQDQKMWTLSVWLYQASFWWAETPWIVTAGFVIASIPTLLVFLFCQKIIMRGIIVPSMK